MLCKNSNFHVFQACKDQLWVQGQGQCIQQVPNLEEHILQTLLCTFYPIPGHVDSSGQTSLYSRVSSPHPAAQCRHAHVTPAEGSKHDFSSQVTGMFWVETVWMNQMLQHPQLRCRDAILFLNCTQQRSDLQVSLFNSKHILQVPENISKHFSGVLLPSQPGGTYTETTAEIQLLKEYSQVHFHR